MEEEQARGDELARKLRETMAKVSDSYEDLQNEREKTEKLEVSVKDLTRICEEHRKQNTAAQHGPDAAHAAEAAHVAGATPQAFDIAPADRNLALLRDVQDERDALSALLKSSQRQCDELRAEVARVKVKCRSMENTQTSFRSQSDTWQRITQDMQEQLSATEGQLETAEEKRLRAEKQRDLAEQQLNAEKQCKEEAEGLVHALEQEICVLEGTIREQHQDGAAFCDVVDPPATAEERALLVALPSSAEAEPSAERCTRGAPAHDFVNAPTAGTGKLVVDHSGWPVLPVHVRPGDLEDGHGGIEDGGRRGVSFARGAQAAEVADGVEEEEKEEEIEEIEDVEEASVDTWDSPAAAVWRHRGESAPSLRGAGFGGSAFGLGGASRFSETWHGWRPADASQFAALAFDDGTENSDSYTAGREESPRRDEAPLRSRSAGDSPSRSGTASTSNVHSPPSARRGIASASAANVRSSSARVGEQLTPPVAPHGQGPSAAFHAAQPRLRSAGDGRGTRGRSGTTGHCFQRSCRRIRADTGGGDGGDGGGGARRTAAPRRRARSSTPPCPGERRSPRSEPQNSRAAGRNDEPVATDARCCRGVWPVEGGVSHGDRTAGGPGRGIRLAAAERLRTAVLGLAASVAALGASHATHPRAGAQ